MRNIKTAVVLVGGQGLRLRPLTNDLPKAMVEIGGRPLVDWVLRRLAKNRIETVVMGKSLIDLQLNEQTTET
jgi:MurNAc alpha-1-phosphate uridylyltransferase